MSKPGQQGGCQDNREGVRTTGRVLGLQEGCTYLPHSLSHVAMDRPSNSYKTVMEHVESSPTIIIMREAPWGVGRVVWFVSYILHLEPFVRWTSAPNQCVVFACVDDGFERNFFFPGAAPSTDSNDGLYCIVSALPLCTGGCSNNALVEMIV